MATTYGTDSKLRYFFSAYFHNFWPDESGNWEVVVNNFVTNNPVESVHKAIDELDGLLDEDNGEASLKKIVTRKLGANVYPPGLDMTYREWLEAVAVRLTGS